MNDSRIPRANGRKPRRPGHAGHPPREGRARVPVFFEIIFEREPPDGEGGH